MLLFTRMSVLAGAPGELMPAVLAVTERVNAVVDNEISLWAGGIGFPVGAFAWSGRVESHAQVAENNAKLLGDAEYAELVGALGQFRTGESTDSLRQLIHGDPPAETPPVGTIVLSSVAQVSAGNIMSAMTWGVEMTQLVSKITGNPTSFYRDLYGSFGSVVWLAGLADAAALDAAHAALGADPAYVEKLDQGAGLFRPGSGSQGFATRVA